MTWPNAACFTATTTTTTDCSKRVDPCGRELSPFNVYCASKAVACAELSYSFGEGLQVAHIQQQSIFQVQVRTR
jgi:hypothetical protein